MLSERLYTLRKESGLSQKELAAILGVTDKAVSKWETGAARPKTATILKLAEIYKISTEELLCEANAHDEEKIKQAPPTLLSISQQAAQLVDNQPSFTNEKIEDTIFTVKSSRFYLICSTILFTSIFLLLLSFFSQAIESIPQLFGVWEIWFFSATLSVLLTGLFTGIFIFVRIIKRFSRVVLIVFILLLGFTYFVLLFGGTILLIPCYIKAIRVLINSKKENIDG